MKVLAGVGRNCGKAVVYVPIDISNEPPQRYARIQRPVTRENMIEVYVGQDPTVAAIRFRKSRHTRFEPRVSIGESVDCAMATDPSLERLRKSSQPGRGREIRQEIADAKLRIGFGEVKVSEPVHLCID